MFIYINDKSFLRLYKPTATTKSAAYNFFCFDNFLFCFLIATHHPLIVAILLLFLVIYTLHCLYFSIQLLAGLLTSHENVFCLGTALWDNNTPIFSVLRIFIETSVIVVFRYRNISNKEFALLRLLIQTISQMRARGAFLIESCLNNSCFQYI